MVFIRVISKPLHQKFLFRHAVMSVTVLNNLHVLGSKGNSFTACMASISLHYTFLHLSFIMLLHISCVHKSYMAVASRIHIKLWMNCCMRDGSDGLLLVFHHAGLSSIPCQSMQDLWLAKWHWTSFPIVPLSVLFHHCLIFIHIPPTV